MYHGLFSFNHGKTTALDVKISCGRSNIDSCTEAWLPKATWKVDKSKHKKSFDSNRSLVLTQSNLQFTTQLIT